MMNLRLLVDGIVRQTTILVAQLSTTSGLRSPLAHVADQVFLQLSRELESQGVKRAVAADMFGMALRSYQKKLQRVTESSSDQGVTLWQAVHDFVKREEPTRRRIAERFARDSEREVAAVLHDLVSSGLVFVTGNGHSAVYGTTSEALRNQVLDLQDTEAVANVIWLRVFQGEAKSKSELVQLLGLDARLIERALAELSASGRVSEEAGTLVARNLVIPLGTESGAETAMLDHFRAVCKVLARRAARLDAARQHEGASVATDTTAAVDSDGGSTFSFTLYPGHPFEEEVQQLLSKNRAATQTLWERVAAHNQTHRVPAKDTTRVTYYVGQVADMDEQEEA
jgi:hypothetical protein